MARTPAAVAEVQKLLLARAATDASLNTWESWGEIAAALGRLPYDTARAGRRPLKRCWSLGLPSPDSMTDVETAAIVGAVRGFESLARTMRAKKLPPLGDRTWDLLRWAATAQRPAADPRSRDHRRLAMAALVTGNQATASVIERGAERCRRRSAAVCGGGRGHRRARSTSAMRMLKIGAGRQGCRGCASRPARLGPAAAEDLVRAGPAALRDADPHVMLQAIDLLGNRLPRRATTPPRASSRRSSNTLDDAAAHVARAGARAGVAGAPSAGAGPRRRCRGSCSTRPGRCGCMRRAPPGSLGGDRRARRRWRRDRHDNVREAALAALIELKRPEAVDRGDRRAARPDYQLILTAVRALEDKPLAAKADRAAAHARSARITQGTQGHLARSAHGDPRSPADATATRRRRPTSKATSRISIRRSRRRPPTS